VGTKEIFQKLPKSFGSTYDTFWMGIEFKNRKPTSAAAVFTNLQL